MKRVYLMDRAAIEERREELLELIESAERELEGLDWLLKQDSEG